MFKGFGLIFSKVLVLLSALNFKILIFDGIRKILKIIDHHEFLNINDILLLIDLHLLILKIKIGHKI